MHYLESMDQSCEQEVYESSFMILSIGVSALEPLTNQHVVAVPPFSVRAECSQRPAISHEIGANLTRLVASTTVQVTCSKFMYTSKFGWRLVTQTSMRPRDGAYVLTMAISRSLSLMPSYSEPIVRMDQASASRDIPARHRRESRSLLNCTKTKADGLAPC